MPTRTESPQPTALDDMAATARRILSENLDIAQRMLEHLKSQFGKPLQPEKFPIAAKPIEDQPRAEKVWIQELVVASPSNRLSSQKFGKSPRGKFLLIPRKGVGFSFGIAHETSLLQIKWEEQFRSQSKWWTSQ